MPRMLDEERSLLLLTVQTSFRATISLMTWYLLPNNLQRREPLVCRLSPGFTISTLCFYWTMRSQLYIANRALRFLRANSLISARPEVSDKISSNIGKDGEDEENSIHVSPLVLISTATSRSWFGGCICKGVEAWHRVSRRETVEHSPQSLFQDGWGYVQRPFEKPGTRSGESVVQRDLHKDRKSVV